MELRNFSVFLILEKTIFMLQNISGHHWLFKDLHGETIHRQMVCNHSKDIKLNEPNVRYYRYVSTSPNAALKEETSERGPWNGLSVRRCHTTSLRNAQMRLMWREPSGKGNSKVRAIKSVSLSACCVFWQNLEGNPDDCMPPLLSPNSLVPYVDNNVESLVPFLPKLVK